MKLLTVTQPWASLIAIGAKRIETRSWQTSYRGPIAIHAAKTLNGIFRGADERDLAAIVKREPFASALAPLVRDAREEDLIETLFPLSAEGARVLTMPRGCIVAIAELVDVEPTEVTDVDPADAEWAFGDYSPGRYAWLLDNVRALPAPVECRGERGLVAVAPETERLIFKQMEGAA